MDQANQQSTTVDSAAQAIEQSGIIDSIYANEEANPQAPEMEREEAETSEIEETETDETELESSEGVDEEDGEEEVEVDESEEGEESESEEEQVEIESVSQLAEALEVSPEDLLDNLKIDIIVDGETQSVTLREAQAGYQKDADYRKKTGELANAKREFESKQQEVYQQTEYQHQVAANMLLAAERELMGELQNINFDSLKETDPMAWTAKRADLIERQQQLQGLKQQAAQAYMQHSQQTQQEQQQALMEKLSQEKENLLKLIPDFESVKPKLDGYLADSYGFTDDDLASVADHRLVDLARKAMLYDQMQSNSNVVKKKVKKAPKMQKPAKQTRKPESKSEKLRVSKSRLKKSGHIRDAASAIESLL